MGAARLDRISRATCGIIRRSPRRSQRLDRPSLAGHDGRGVCLDDGSPSRGWPLAHYRRIPRSRGERCSCRPRQRLDRERLRSVTRPSRRAWLSLLCSGPVEDAKNIATYRQPLGAPLVPSGFRRFSTIPHQLSLAPMRLFASGLNSRTRAPARFCSTEV